MGRVSTISSRQNKNESKNARLERRIRTSNLEKKSTHTNEDKQQRITDNKNSMPSYISTLKSFGNVEIEGKDQTEKLKEN